MSMRSFKILATASSSVEAAEANGLHHADGCTLVAGSPHPMYMLCEGTGRGVSPT